MYSVKVNNMAYGCWCVLCVLNNNTCTVYGSHSMVIACTVRLSTRSSCRSTNCHCVLCSRQVSMFIIMCFHIQVELPQWFLTGLVSTQLYPPWLHGSIDQAVLTSSDLFRAQGAQEFPPLKLSFPSPGSATSITCTCMYM